MAGKGKPGLNKGDKRLTEYGKKGGKALREEYGIEHFAAMGRKGGSTTLAKHGPEFYREMGAKGLAAKAAKKANAQ